MLSYRVAGLKFGIESAKEKKLEQAMINYAPFKIDGATSFHGARPYGTGATVTTDEAYAAAQAASAGKHIFVLNADTEITVPQTTPLKIFDYALTGGRARLRIYEDELLLSLSGHSGQIFRLRCSFGANTRSADESTTPPCENIFYSDLALKGISPPLLVINHMMVFAFSVAALPHRALIIHASTIIFNGKAVMFLGESGTGKSTHSGLWLKHIPKVTMLNDDGPVMKVENGKVIAYGSPWSGKTPCYKNESYPLAACVRIKRASFNRAEKLSPSRAFSALLPSTLPSLQLHSAALDQICDTLSDAIRAVQVFTLECLPDADAAFTSRKAVFGETECMHP